MIPGLYYAQFFLMLTQTVHLLFFSFIFIFVALFPACHYSFPLVHSDGLDCSKDAVYLSPHKFIGGVGTPGKPVIYRTKENK